MNENCVTCARSTINKSCTCVNPQLIPLHNFPLIRGPMPSTVTRSLLLGALSVETPIRFSIQTLTALLLSRSRDRELFAQYFSTYFSNLTPILAVWGGCGLSGGTRTGCWCTWPSIIFLLRAAWYSLPRIYSHSSLRMIRLAPPTTTTTTTVVFQDTNNVNYVIAARRATIFLLSLFSLSFAD